jgi:hypothetical protein
MAVIPFLKIMKRFTALLLLLPIRGVLAQEAKPAERPNFAPLEFLVGSCWVGTFPDGKQTDEHCFEWVFDKKFIRDRHVVRGGAEPYQGETIYRWDPVTKQIAYTYWASNGLVITGTAEGTPDGVVFPSRYSTAKGDVEIKALWRRTGADGYRTSQSQRAAGDSAWKPMWAMEFKRKR